MMARVRTRPAQPPAAWTMRPRIRVPMENASGADDAAQEVDDEAADHGRAPAEAVGEGAEGQHRHRDREGGEAERELGRGRADGELVLDHRQGREEDLHRERPQRRRQDQDQEEAARERLGGVGGHALPIRMPVTKTRTPPSTIWKAARRKGVSM